MNHSQHKTLVVMAAGMGSRYGGLKQLEGVGPQGELILDYSLWDAAQAGFHRAVLIIQPQMEKVFMDRLHPRVKAALPINFAIQDCSDPLINRYIHGFDISQRKKPWGTGHAALCAKPYVQGHFAIINADDYYGEAIFQYLAQAIDAFSINAFEGALVGYRLHQTLSDYGGVSRAVAVVQHNRYVHHLTEYTQIQLEDLHHQPTVSGYNPLGMKEHLDGQSWVSLNTWAFSPGFWSIAEENLVNFLKKINQDNCNQSEYYLPDIAQIALSKHPQSIAFYGHEGPYYGLTYANDLPKLQHAIAQRGLLFA